MLQNMFFGLLVMAILFLILTVKWESFSLGILDIILWFILGGAVHSIEIPYTAIQSDNTIVHGINEIQDLQSISLIFIGIGIIVFIYWFTTMLVPMLRQRFTRMM